MPHRNKIVVFSIKMAVGDDPLFGSPDGDPSHDMVDISSTYLNMKPEDRVAVRSATQNFLQGAKVKLPWEEGWVGGVGGVSYDLWVNRPSVASTFDLFLNVGSIVTDYPKISGSIFVASAALLASKYGVQNVVKALSDGAEAAGQKVSGMLKWLQDKFPENMNLISAIMGIANMFRNAGLTTWAVVAKAATNMCNLLRKSWDALVALRWESIKKAPAAIRRMFASTLALVSEVIPAIKRIWDTVVRKWHSFRDGTSAGKVTGRILLEPFSEVWKSTDFSLASKVIRVIYVLANYISFVPVPGLSYIMPVIIAVLAIVDLNACEWSCQNIANARKKVQDIGGADYVAKYEENSQTQCVAICEARPRGYFMVSKNRQAFAPSYVFTQMLGTKVVYVKGACLVVYATYSMGSAVLKSRKQRSEVYNPKSSVYDIQSEQDLVDYAVKNKLPKITEREFKQIDKSKCIVAVLAVQRYKQELLQLEEAKALERERLGADAWLFDMMPSAFAEDFEASVRRKMAPEDIALEEETYAQK